MVICVIDLHLHLDGSLSVDTILTLAQELHVQLPSKNRGELKSYLTAPANCQSLNEYLMRFQLPLRVLQWPQAVSYAVKELLRSLEGQGIVYTEIRFAPQLCTEKGYSPKTMVEAALQGLKEAQTLCSIQAQLILCCMRGEKNHKENLETVDLAAAFLHKGIAAVDLAGAEALYPTQNFGDIFERAQKFAIPITIHAGEAAGPESIWTALSFGAARIGHGVRAREDLQLVEALLQKGVFLEMCPSSNLQTKAVRDIHDHPILGYLHKGLCVGVHTDNMTVSATTLKKEFALLKKELSMTKKDETALLINSAEAAFLPKKAKQQLKHAVLQKMGE